MSGNQLSRTRATLTTLAALALTLTIVSIACDGTATDATPQAPLNRPLFTASSGSVSTLLSRATFADPSDQTFKAKRISDDWHAEVKAKPNLDIAVQRIVFQPGGQSGWHHHPGPVFVEVVAGTMSFYESDNPACTPIVRTAGEGYFDDAGEHAHMARNHTGAIAEVIVVYLAPPAGALRTDAPDPGNCPF